MCVFCDPKQIKSQITYIDDCMIFTPLNPVVEGHLLVVPVKHVSDFTADLYVTAKVVAVASTLAHNIGGDFNIISSKGSLATQTINHLHFHLIPRRPNDNLKLPWSA